jgi:hypothetical protein
MPPAYTSSQKQYIAQFVNFTQVKDATAAKVYPTSFSGIRLYYFEYDLFLQVLVQDYDTKLLTVADRP